MFFGNSFAIEYFAIKPNRFAIIHLIAFPLIVAILVSPLLLIGNQLVQLSLATLIIIIALHTWARLVSGTDPAVYGLSCNRRVRDDFFIGLLLGTSAVAVMALLAAALHLAKNIEWMGPAIDRASVLLALKTFVVAVWEEIFFRGFAVVTLWRWLATYRSNRTALTFAAALSSFFFAAAHFFTDHFLPEAFVGLWLNGMVWCVPFLLTGRLGLSIGLHASWNFAQLQIFGFPMSGNSASDAWIDLGLQRESLWTGGDYGPEAGMLGVIGMLAMLLSVLVYVRVSSPKKFPATFASAPERG